MLYENILSHQYPIVILILILIIHLLAIAIPNNFINNIFYRAFFPYNIYYFQH